MNIICMFENGDLNGLNEDCSLRLVMSIHLILCFLITGLIDCVNER